MKKKEVVQKAKDFDLIINKGKRLRNDAFNIFILKENTSFPLFGIAVSKKIANAVYRNKYKRQIRNIVDNNKNSFKNNRKYIIMIKASGIKLSFAEKEIKLMELINKENNEK